MKRLLIYLILLIPLVVLSLQVLIFENVVEPIKYIYTVTGVTATVILFFSITISLMSKKINLVKYRRLIGLFGFFYAFLHLLNFVIFDVDFDIGFIIEETLDKPFIYLGMIAFFILLFMSFTSTKSLFKKYKKQHQFIYLALILITIHFIMAQKSITILQLGYIAMIFILAYCKLLQKIMEINKSKYID
ncbi:sulfite oxidase heme-binding subunit YedZ [Poseidonibacter ostreae]|jgi:methionine sulfoxide reductase heme-binding subunit|uniref:Ferric reductase n=1 Tax=Poseidonibacter ostreae TaxID=2654171 RepID=A0A6L4WQL6_9BACT|nr:ferric reductase-like transmembrane domain-containing protein [Poseidonibacter ostreae]KAB7884353.1 ferric reductase [Poseidonibacter ostreae]KAB7885344.1 ferric reductase [Poseidonibacter ostreae]KAB7888356.1 ferric reductase [Poseidonibacter ostreae]